MSIIGYVTHFYFQQANSNYQEAQMIILCEINSAVQSISKWQAAAPASGAAAAQANQSQRSVVRKETEGEVLDVEKNQSVANGSSGERKGHDFKVQGNASNVEGNKEKGNSGSSSPVSSKDNHMKTHQDGTQAPKSDGLQDLREDTSVDMECSKDQRSVVRKETEGEAPASVVNEKKNQENQSAVNDSSGERKGNDFKVEGNSLNVEGNTEKEAFVRSSPISSKDDQVKTHQDDTQSPESDGLLPTKDGGGMEEVQKGTWTTRTDLPGSRNSNLGDIAETSGSNITERFLSAADISIHTRHLKQMKPHQIKGFDFLVKNLLDDPPGGCILAHAPGSGNTFMLISFIQSFMAKDPHARPLVVLPNGILAAWRKEFQRWQVEDIPVYDFYSSKADYRFQQFEVLNEWQENKSILLLGYEQLANIICGDGDNMITAACQDKLRKVPTLLILDEGHTPRNDNMDMVDLLAKVRTPCKVVLSRTLFQNHVGEVFNILKLVRPNFMKTESSRAIVKRILSQVHISGGRKKTKGNEESYFCDLVEDALQNDEDYKRKIAVIQELRDMTRNVLHYCKGDFFDELPGLVDFTVLLNLGPKQKEVIRSLGKHDKFKKSSLEKAIYIHPQLAELSENASGDKDTIINIDKVDAIIESINVREGAKANFFINLLAMAEDSGEKLLVFSQYLLPLKFLERLVIRQKGWHPGKEIFVISDNSNPEVQEKSMSQFNNSPDAKVFFGSIKACGEGISLVGASRIVILDVHLSPSTTQQAIGCAFRLGQEKKVYVYRLVAADSQEEEDHNTSFRKETISKLWFEWSEHHGPHDFELDAINTGDSDDRFFENPALCEDIKALYIR